jgi:hypothetical protein
VPVRVGDQALGTQQSGHQSRAIELRRPGGRAGETEDQPPVGGELCIAREPAKDASVQSRIEEVWLVRTYGQGIGSALEDEKSRDERDHGLPQMRCAFAPRPKIRVASDRAPCKGGTCPSRSADKRVVSRQNVLTEESLAGE